jgi:glycosyltransferase involved in cell wall biosynthesis
MTRFDRLLAITGYIADGWQKQGVPPERVIIIHDGVNPATARSLGRRSREEIRADLGVPEGRLLVAMVGNIRDWKGQHVVIAALREMDPAERARLYVAFVGTVRKEDETYFDELRRSIEEGGLSEVVAFTGERTDVPEIFSASDIAVHASVKPEPGGMVVLEAMSFGAPIVCANKGGLLDFLEPGVALTHDVNDPRELARQLTLLARNPEMRESMIAKARTRAAQFSVEQTARKTEAVYDDLLKK